MNTNRTRVLTEGGAPSFSSGVPQNEAALLADPDLARRRPLIRSIAQGILDDAQRLHGSSKKRNVYCEQRWLEAISDHRHDKTMSKHMLSLHARLMVGGYGYDGVWRIARSAHWED